MTPREHEGTLNVQLADELRKRALDAKPEVMHPRALRVDVEVRVGPVTIAVEAEHGQSAAKRAESLRDADARLQQGLAQCAVAVCYPDDTTRESLPHARLAWTARDGADDRTDWTFGSIDQLASVIRLMPAQLGNPDYAAAALSVSLDGAVRRLGDGQKSILAQKLDLPPDSSPPHTSGRRRARPTWNRAAKRTLLVLATAVMFHSRLDIYLNALRPEQDNRQDPPGPFADDWPPMTARDCTDADDPLSAFIDAWTLILALDYKPIFQTARAALRACPPDPAFADAVRETARAALVVSAKIAGLRHDLLGRIFHTVLDTARYDGSFYTTTAAATLLAALAIRKDMCDWTDPDAIARLRIIDPACGTGTLLMAAAERIRELSPDYRDDESVASALIEQVLCGYDVNLTATHMAATTLGLLSPTTRFRNMKIGRAFLGVDDDGQTFLGSLEFLDQQPKLIPWPNGGQAFSQVDAGDDMAHPDSADLVIMNPPFTRSDLRHDQFSAEEEQKLKDREKELFSKKPVHLSHSGGAFLTLADFLIKRDSASIAVILPLVGATNYSTAEMRKMLAQRYHVETIVTSHDPERIYFSENTSIGEMLIVFRRWADRRKPKPPTRVVNLARNPSTPADALAVAWAVEDGTVKSKEYGTIQHWPEYRIHGGNWGAVQFLSPFLCEQFDAMRHGRFFESVALGKVAEIGPDGVGARTTFNRSSLPGIEPMSALWHHKTDVTQSMSASTDTYIDPKPGKERQAKSLWERRGTLMLPMRVRLNTVRTLGVRLNMPALGSLWTPCKPANIGDKPADAVEKALCVYVNSSIGVLALLGDRTNKVPSYPGFSMRDLRNLVIPNFAAVDGAVARLVKAYDAHAKDALLPLPSMDDCPTRRALDDAVVEALGVDAETVSAIRRSLAAEPSITGKRYTGRPVG